MDGGGPFHTTQHIFSFVRSFSFSFLEGGSGGLDFFAPLLGLAHDGGLVHLHQLHVPQELLPRHPHIRHTTKHTHHTLGQSQMAIYHIYIYIYIYISIYEIVDIYYCL